MIGKKIGYIRVSTVDQNPERQLEGVFLDKKFVEYASGKNRDRPQLKALIGYIREDDHLYIHSIDRLARNARDLFELVDYFVKKNISVTFTKQNLTFNGNDSAMAKFQLGIMAAYAEFEREIHLERQREGIALAKRAGKYKGRRSKFNDEIKQKIIEKMQTRDTKTQIAHDLGISRECLYRYLARIKNESNNT